MKEKIKVLNFQDLQINNVACSNKPFDETTFDGDILKMIILRDPFEYFNDLMDHYIHTVMSPRLSKETQKAMKALESEPFLK